MKKIVLAALVAVIALSTVSCNQKAGKTDELNDSAAIVLGKVYGHIVSKQLQDPTRTDKVDKDAFLRGMGMAMRVDTANIDEVNGVQFGLQMLDMLRNMKAQGVEIDRRHLVAEFKKAFNDTTTLDQSALMQMQMEAQTVMDRVIKKAKLKDPKVQANLENGKKYIDSTLKADKEFKQLPSGLIYKVITDGSGDKFKSTDVVQVKYTGKHLDGTVFDTSSDRVVDFPMNSVVVGFQQMLMEMNPGMKVLCVIPSELAYGEDGNRGIEPNETLVFEIEAIGAKAQE